ncbi:FAD:protein FMN transferase [Desulfonema ishimotonii]|uniref:FAD:protein FMN transferase n=1 Tax=Desulfonema ishimotonii TaxID=45657 RepID=A0A401G208_9BACT|nr:FAD:protein FMN transferase [Desulfonema ishimotonii]GBC63254.1 FAD:protein FMN transferase [Desulfonema ishimotonii]
MRKLMLLIFFFLLLPVSGYGAAEKQQVLLQGRTMGTTWHITVVTSGDTDALKQKIDRRLTEINRSMSTYDKTSEISRFNRLKNTGEKFSVTEDFLQVMTVAKTLHGLTDGAWDGTIGPLINLWGFGSRQVERHLPAAEEIRALMPHVGFGHIEIFQDGYLVKKDSQIYLDLASVAKGYGVDQVARVIAESGIGDYLVEIGGEIYASGRRPDGKPWRIGINKPTPDAGFTEVYKVAALEDRGFATSGDYRNFFEAGGRRYSHVLNPGTGYAVSNGVVSASVMADTCAFADGLATALMVMGHEKGLALVSRLEKVEALMIVEGPDGTLKEYYSENFKDILED